MIKYHALNLDVVASKEQVQTLEGRLAILQTQMQAQQSLMEAKKKRNRSKKKATNDNAANLQAQASDDTVFASGASLTRFFYFYFISVSYLFSVLFSFCSIRSPINSSEIQSSSSSSEESQAEDIKPVVVNGSTGVKKEKKKPAGGLDDDMIADIIFGMDKAVCCLIEILLYRIN
jgi:hypothetical protein